VAQTDAATANNTAALGELITELRQYRTLLEWAFSSKNAGELLPLPKGFRSAK